MIKKYALGAVIIVLLLISAFFIYKKLNPQTLAENLIAGSGRLDGDIIALNTKYPGRIESVLIQEGQSIKRGDAVAVLQSDEFKAKLRAMNKTIAAANEGLVAMEQEYQITKKSIPLEIRKAKQAVEIAQAQKKELQNNVLILEALVSQDQRDYDRIQALSEKKLIGQQKVELAKLKLDSDSNKLAALQQKTIQAEKGVSIAKDTVELAQLQQKRLIAIRANINATKSNIGALEANREELQITIDQIVIK